LSEPDLEETGQGEVGNSSCGAASHITCIWKDNNVLEGMQRETQSVGANHTPQKNEEDKRHQINHK